MAYLGRGLDKISNIEVLDNITFDGSSSYSITKGSVAFTPNSAQSCLISIDGVVQATNFTVSSSTIDFGVAIPSTSVCNFFLHYGTGVMTVPSDGSVTTAKLGDGSVTSAKLDSGVALGKVLQVVSTTKSDSFSTTSNSMVDVTNFNASITPSSTSSKIFAIVTCGSFINDNGSKRAFMQIVRGSTNITAGDSATGEEVGSAVCGRSNDGGHHQFPTVISVLDSPSTTSATTYKIQVSRGGDAGGTVRLNRSGAQDSFSGNTISTLTVMEIGA